MKERRDAEGEIAALARRRRPRLVIATDSIELAELPQHRGLHFARRGVADAAWGESFASQVLAQGRLLIQDPKPGVASDDRLHQAYLLGLPIGGNSGLKGALIFVRFGGPVYTEDHIRVARIAADLRFLLYDRVAWRNTNAELRELKRQMQLQEDFVSTISHELRTPLGLIKGYSTSLLREDTTWDAETQREFLTIIGEEADRLSLLIENVLESARLQSRTLQRRFQPLRLDAVIRDVIARLRVRHKDLDIRMELDNTPSIYADGVRLAQVIENLFTNAIKYAPGAPVSVSLEHSGENVLISFQDEGPGAAALP